MLHVLFIVFIILKVLVILVPVLMAVAFLTLFERKIMAAMQSRSGPNVVGVWGVLQPFADALKLLSSETVMPVSANSLVFILSPMISLVLSLVSWAFMPFDENVVLVDSNMGILIIFALSSLAVYGIMMSGWASNSKYAFLGCLRSAAQMISYEVSFGLIVLSVLVLAGSFNLTAMVKAQEAVFFVFPLFPLFMMFFMSTLAETNRTPFDLPEAEGELVAGYFVEYSSVGFALFFMAEYSNMLLMGFLNALLFFGGWLPLFSGLDFIPGVVWLALKVVFFCFAFIWVRATLPSYRYDQLMLLGWKFLLPLSLAFFMFVSGFFFFWGWTGSFLFA